jgi:UDP:flavonoid glycosyltransferase YjiC (YdhE family)
MRILFCASPGVGHVEPMMPLLATMAQRGHEVAWAGALESHARARSVGIAHCFQVGPGSAETRVEYLRRWPAASNAEGPASDPHVFPRRFGALLAPAMLDPLVRAIETWKASLVISELGVLAAPLACRVTGSRQVTHGFGMPPPSSVLDQAAAEFATQWQGKTLRSPPAEAGLFDSLYLDIYPESLQTPDRLRVGPRRQCLRPSSPATGLGGKLPAMVARFLPIADRPLVYLTFGTVVNGSKALAVATRALADLDARIIVTVGADGDSSLLGELPPNVHVEPFIPQTRLLPHCALVVSHGGSGTFLSALAHGVPQLALPQGADQFINASALEAGGAGLALRGDEVTIDSVRASAMRLLQEFPYRRQAERYAREISAMPSADDVAARLEALDPYGSDGARQGPALVE